MNTAVALRILDPKARLLGPADGDALQNLDTTDLPEGSECWVADQAAYYVLRRDSVDSPAEPIVVAPASGPGRWIQLVTVNPPANTIQTNIDSWNNESGIPSGLNDYRFTTLATELTFTIQFNPAQGINPPNECAVNVDGVWTYYAFSGAAFETHTITLGPGFHTVILRSAPTLCQQYPNQLVQLATFVQAFCNAPISVERRKTPADRIVVVGDSICPFGIGADHPTTQGGMQIVVDTYPNASFEFIGGGGASLYEQTLADPTLASFAQFIADRAKGTRTNTIYIELGVNDYLNSSSGGGGAGWSWTVAQFQTAYGVLLDQVRAIIPNAIIIAQTQLPLDPDPPGIAAWRTAILTACSTRPWVRPIDAPVQYPNVTLGSSNLHPNTAGHALLALYYESVLGLWNFSKLGNVQCGFLSTSPNNTFSGVQLTQGADAGPFQQCPLLEATASKQYIAKLPTASDGPAKVGYIQGTIAAVSVEQTPAPPATTPRYSLLAVLRCDGADGVQQNLMDTLAVNNGTLGRAAGGGLFANGGGGVLPFTGGVTPVGWFAVKVSFNPTSGQTRANVDGGPVTNAAGNSFFAWGGLTLGTAPNLVSNPSNLSCAEFAIVPGDGNGNITAAQGTRIDQHMIARYGIVTTFGTNF